MKGSVMRLMLTLNSHTASDLSDQIARHLKTVLTHAEQEDDPQLLAFCAITSLLENEANCIGSELWKNPRYISDWYRAFDNLLFDGSLLKQAKLEIERKHLSMELRLCWTSGTNYTHRVLNRIDSRADLAGDPKKQRQEILKDLILHQMCYVVLHRYSCSESCCVLSEIPVNGVDTIDHEAAREFLVRVVQNYIARNALMADALGLGLDLQTDADDASGDEDNPESAWDDAWYQD
ncbi:hypothetical protein MMC27_003910 [Xylographa pallens]|nr:hypothetical protein [Xylographa pallens]